VLHICCNRFASSNELSGKLVRAFCLPLVFSAKLILVAGLTAEMGDTGFSGAGAKRKLG